MLSPPVGRRASVDLPAGESEYRRRPRLEKLGHPTVSHQRGAMRGCVRVAVVGAHAIVTAGLRAILDEALDIEVVSPTADDDRPDVVLYDAIDLDHDTGATLDDLVRRHGSKVLVVGRELRPALEARARAHGASGGFSLEASAGEVLRTVREAAARSAVSATPRPCGDGYGWARTLGLTPREFDVLSGITAGLSNDEIAVAHTLSINSVKSYIRYAYRKIGVSTRAQAVAWCLERGFEPPPEHDRPPRGTCPRHVSPWTASLPAEAMPGRGLGGVDAERSAAAVR
jgi:DNA-binding NarL/FixJ family response regulator